MRKLGEGWQYSVYDLENGRVLKKFHPRFQAYWIIFKALFPFKEPSLWIIPKYVDGLRVKLLNSREILLRRQIPPDMVGNPHFINQLDFEQDKVTPLSIILDVDCPLEKGRKAVDDFIIFNQGLLNRGVVDKSFNITKNFGMDTAGKIILTDIGELLDDPISIQNQRIHKAWCKKYVVNEIKNTEIRGYFIMRMNEVFGMH